MIAGAAVLSFIPAYGQKLFYESFDSVPLGPNVEEASKGAKVWTRTPPEGWSVDDTLMPGYGTPDYPANDGRTEWSGWAFADVKWWPTVDNQRRSEFTRASGVAAIADPDEWDDATHLQGFFNSFLSTTEIDVSGKAASSLILTFDSSWRPEGFDDGLPSFPVDADGSKTNNQTAVITAQWDNGTPVEVLRWDSDSNGAFYKPDSDFINEAALVELNNPAGAKKLVLKLGMINAANDWWWAVDNLAVGEPPMLTGVSATGVGFTVRITEALGKTVNTGAPVTTKLDGQPVTVTVDRDPDNANQVVVTHNQAPKIYVPGSSHLVEVSFTTSAGKQVTDTVSFVAPSYMTVSATPTRVAAVIKETDYLVVDDAKGLAVELDGAAITAKSVTRANDGVSTTDTITVIYETPSPLVSGSAHALKAAYTTTTAQPVVETVAFKAPEYQTLPAALATSLGTGAQAGMRWRTHQLEAARPNNNIAASEQQLRGELGASIHDTMDQTAAGYFEVPFVNFDQVAGPAGNFRDTAEGSDQVADTYIPGIPDGHPSNDNIAAEALTFVEIPAAGVYTMVVNSDDGFQVSVGNTNNPTFLVLDKFDAGRGQADSVFYFKADAAGVYFFRLLWFEGGSDARVEWFTVNDDGTRALVNGTQTGALKAYRTRTVPEPALPSTQPTVSVERLGASVKVTFTGTLQRAESVTGPFTDLQVSSPAEVPATSGSGFFRARN